MLSPRHSWPGIRSGKPRSGVCVVELLVVLPLTLMFLWTTIVFGLVLARAHVVAQAAAIGADVASRHVTAADALVPVTTAVDAQLLAAGITPTGTNRQVVVEETISTPAASAATGPALYTPAPESLASARAVRVVVALQLDSLTPDLLATYGFSIASRSIACNSIRRYNGPPLPEEVP